MGETRLWQVTRTLDAGSKEAKTLVRKAKEGAAGGIDSVLQQLEKRRKVTRYTQSRDPQGQSTLDLAIAIAIASDSKQPERAKQR